MSVLPGNGDGTFQSPTSYEAGLWPGSISAADLDGGDLKDLLVDAGGKVCLLRGWGDGSCGEPYQLGSAIPHYVDDVPIRDFIGNDLRGIAALTESGVVEGGDVAPEVVS
ncbi:MAG: hypothetical protein ACOCR1_03315 [Planctomycetota bacterium]